MLPFRSYIWDIETYASCFLFTGKFHGASEHQVFEISPRKNQRNELLGWLNYLQNDNVHMVGYNSLGFDYPIIHELLVNPYQFDHIKAYQFSQKIIEGGRYGSAGFGFSVKMSDRIIPQIDLVKINHFDNPNKRTSLKSLEFALRMESIEDLPYDFHAPRLTDDQIEDVKAYNLHDVKATELFFERNIHLIAQRLEMLQSGDLRGDVLNFSDVKIGEQILISRIGRDKCYSGSKPKQSIRGYLRYRDMILPKITFRTEPYQTVLDWFKTQEIHVHDTGKPKLEARLGGIDFAFGVGGVHASVERKVYVSNETHVIRDVDVAGMYVAVGVSNDFYPEHLGTSFLPAYRQLQKDRALYPKGTAKNAMLKLGGNGAFGNSGNEYSPFFDPKYLYTITLNGQLQLLQLAERFSLIPGIELIQANTDGITAYVRRDTLHLFDLWKTDWENETRLKLEEVEYKRMWIRDVNSYIAEYTNGKVKRKGAYWYPEKIEEYDGVWNKDFSMLAVAKAADIVMRHNVSAEQAIKLIADPFDFMIRYKTVGGAKVFIGDKECSKTIRYFVSKNGHPMKKVSSPKGTIGDYKRSNGLTDTFFNKIKSEIAPGTWDARIHTKNKSKYEMNTTKIEGGFLVTNCNVASNFNWADLDYDYYIKEVQKLIIGAK